MKSISTVVIVLLLLGFLFIALPQKGFAGIPMPPSEPTCCQYIAEEGGEFTCEDGLDGFCQEIKGENLIVLPGERCNIRTNLCQEAIPSANVPTLSEWGLIAMAGVLGLIGFMVIRRRKVTA
ncbi:MAG: IPTL-CTERM sorting domain-containing protein [Thermodesulfobacteriota bacterium]